MAKCMYSAQVPIYTVRQKKLHHVIFAITLWKRFTVKIIIDTYHTPINLERNDITIVNLS